MTPRPVQSHPPRAAARLAVALLLPAALALAACQNQSPFAALDAEATHLTHRQQQTTLGRDAALLDPPAPPPGDPIPPADAHLYDYDPATTNPPAQDLTVAPAAITTTNGTIPYPQILDDGQQPDTLRLDLTQLLAYAIERSPEYRRQKEDLYLTTLSLIIERHEWGPRFFSTLTGRVDGVPEAGDNDTALSLLASLGITQRLPYGGTISAAALVDYVRFLERAATNNLPDETSATELQLGIDLPLLRGAGRAAPTVESRIQAERDLVYAVRAFERFRREFFVDLATTYFDLLRRQGQLANRDLQLQNLEQSAELFTALAAAGRQTYYQAQRAEQRVLRARNQLLNQRENYAQQLDALKLRLGVPVTQPLEITPVDIQVPEVLLEPQRAVLTGWDLRLDLQTAGSRVADAKRGVLIAKNALLPDLDLNADLTIPTDETIQRGGLDFQVGDGEYAVELALGIPLDRKIENVQLRTSLIRLEQQQRDYRTARDRVALQIRAAVRSIGQAAYVVQLQDRAVEINERRAEQIRINQRDLGPREVIDVQEDLLDARDDRDAARSELRISILEFLLATGQMRVGPDGQWQAPAPLRDAADRSPTTPLPATTPEPDGA